ncbi:MAG: hypothetical protein KME64_22975 [Scytonematopsis contorta HA4267-MV1]|nr:hypothetical protein [Scytonematopsis contorta HA4267-MV1]
MPKRHAARTQFAIRNPQFPIPNSQFPTPQNSFLGVHHDQKFDHFLFRRYPPP